MRLARPRVQGGHDNASQHQQRGQKDQAGGADPEEAVSRILEDFAVVHLGDQQPLRFGNFERDAHCRFAAVIHAGQHFALAAQGPAGEERCIDRSAQAQWRYRQMPQGGEKKHLVAFAPRQQAFGGSAGHRPLANHRVEHLRRGDLKQRVADHHHVLFRPNHQGHKDVEHDIVRGVARSMEIDKAGPPIFQRLAHRFAMLRADLGMGSIVAQGEMIGKVVQSDRGDLRNRGLQIAETGLQQSGCGGGLAAVQQASEVLRHDAVGGLAQQPQSVTKPALNFPGFELGHRLQLLLGDVPRVVVQHRVDSVQARPQQGDQNADGHEPLPGGWHEGVVMLGHDVPSPYRRARPRATRKASRICLRSSSSSQGLVRKR